MTSVVKSNRAVQPAMAFRKRIGFSSVIPYEPSMALGRYRTLCPAH